MKREPCDATHEIGGYLFECMGHHPGAQEAYAQLHNGVVCHYSESPRAVGDVEITWWTRYEPKDGESRS